MRNAAARLDDDFGSDRPASKSKSRAKTAASKSKKKTAGRPKRNPSRYVKYAAVGLTAALTLGIMINALALQNGKHPAPLFGKAIRLGDQPASLDAPPAHAALQSEPAAVIPAVVEPVPMPPQAPAGHDDQAPVAHAHHTVMESPPPGHHSKPQKEDQADDPIADFLKVSAPNASAEKPKEDSKTVLAAQHALQKLGFVVAPNGTFGPATRTALQAFERENHLPLTDELSRKVLKELSAESGVAID